MHFSRLSVVAWLLLLQAFAIVVMIFVVIIGMNLTGRGKHIDPDRRDGDLWIQARSPVAFWMRDHGWMLLAIPAGLAASRPRGSETSPPNPTAQSRFAIVAIALTIGVSILGLCAIGQAFSNAGGLHRHPDPVPEQH